MCTTQANAEAHQEAEQYEIRLRGHLDDRWAACFEGLRITREANGDTLLTGPVVDQAALHGMLRTVRDLGLPLVSVLQLNRRPANEPHTGSDPSHHLT
jgi:hypothetical protein